MPKPFRLQRGMYLVITRVLPFETPSLVAWGFDYSKVWQYWIDNKDREWDLAFVRTSEVEGPDGIQEHHSIWLITKPIPPKRMALKLAKRANGNAY